MKSYKPLNILFEIHKLYGRSDQEANELARLLIFNYSKYNSNEININKAFEKRINLTNHKNIILNGPKNLNSFLSLEALIHSTDLPGQFKNKNKLLTQIQKRITRNFKNVLIQTDLDKLRSPDTREDEFNKLKYKVRSFNLKLHNIYHAAKHAFDKSQSKEKNFFKFLFDSEKHTKSYGRTIKFVKNKDWEKRNYNDNQKRKPHEGKLITKTRKREKEKILKTFDETKIMCCGYNTVANHPTFERLNNNPSIMKSEKVIQYKNVQSEYHQLIMELCSLFSTNHASFSEFTSLDLNLKNLLLKIKYNNATNDSYLLAQKITKLNFELSYQGKIEIEEIDSEILENKYMSIFFEKIFPLIGEEDGFNWLTNNSKGATKHYYSLSVKTVTSIIKRRFNILTKIGFISILKNIDVDSIHDNESVIGAQGSNPYHLNEHLLRLKVKNSDFLYRAIISSTLVADRGQKMEEYDHFTIGELNYIWRKDKDSSQKKRIMPAERLIITPTFYIDEFRQVHDSELSKDLWPDIYKLFTNNQFRHFSSLLILNIERLPHYIRFEYLCALLAHHKGVLFSSPRENLTVKEYLTLISTELIDELERRKIK